MRVGVRCIFTECDALLLGIFLDLLTLHVDQWTDEAVLHRSNATETDHTDSTHQVHEQCLHNIIPVVRGREDRDPRTFHAFAEPSVTHGARSHLDRDALRNGQSTSIHLGNKTGNAERGTPSHEPAVPIARFTAQAMVHVHSGHRMASLVQQMHQHHTIHPPAHRHKDRSTVRQHAILLKGALDGVLDHGCRAFSTDIAFN